MALADQLATENELFDEVPQQQPVEENSSTLIKSRYLKASDIVPQIACEESSQQILDSYATPDLPDEIEYQFNPAALYDKIKAQDNKGGDFLDYLDNEHPGAAVRMRSQHNNESSMATESIQLIE